MLKRKILFWLLIIALLLTGCKTLPSENTKPTNDMQPPTTTEATPKPHAMYGWTGEFSEEKLKETIERYQENCTPYISDGEDVTSVSFEINLSIASVDVPRLSSVNDSNIESELRGYIDTRVNTMHINKRITVATDWWYGSNGWTRQIPIWSYLVSVKDGEGAKHYYYFRVKYTEPQNDAEY